MTANALAVEFGLFRHDALLCRAMIRIEEQQKTDEFEWVDTSEVSDASSSSNGHLVVRHRFDLPAASLQLWLIRYVTPESRAEIILEAALAIGVHDSDDWESVALGEEYTFAFRCQQES